jgi:PhzF family phenazine biosynthesis protein
MANRATSHDLAAALIWITGVLDELGVSYQFVGGLAAMAYGSLRPLVDIDLYVPDEKALRAVAAAASEYMEAAPEPYRDAQWDLTFLKLMRHGWRIEVAAASGASVWDRRVGGWSPAGIRFSESRQRVVAGVAVPVMALDQLIDYKAGLGRDVDRLDVEALRSGKRKGSLYRLAAFTTTAEGGNPAGVWIGDRLPDPTEMLRIARGVGYSETAFLAPADGARRTVRYYSPEAEVPFCGHATIAAGVRLGELHGEGQYVFETVPGEVAVAVERVGGHMEAALTSVTPRHLPAPPELLEAALAALNWDAADLALDIPPAVAFAGAWHLVLAVSTAERLAELHYDFEALKRLMLDADLTTLQLLWREDSGLYHARDPFPVGGVVEDPATGAAAAAFGGYLRDAGLIEVPASILILQGEAMGRPSRLGVRIPPTGGIVVSGAAVRLDGEA